MFLLMFFAAVCFLQSLNDQHVRMHNLQYFVAGYFVRDYQLIELCNLADLLGVDPLSLSWISTASEARRAIQWMRLAVNASGIGASMMSTTQVVAKGHKLATLTLPER